MNALEMAEELEKGPLVPRDDAAKMIRQQQAEIEALKQIIDANNLSQNIGQFVKPVNEPVAWKAYEEVHFSDQYILRWVREGDEYVNRMTKEMMKDFKSLAVKELTDEEIKSEAKYFCHSWHSQNPERLVLFARAILRKAQEK